jgi:hypothetical protein
MHEYWLVALEHGCNTNKHAITQRFSGEKYLAHPIGNILSGQSGERTIAEFVHPVLAPMAHGPGRRPAIDFAVCDPYPKIAVGVESKWIGRAALDVGSIV